MAIHIRAKKNFVDRFGNRRKCGECWLVTREDCESYLLAAEEELVCTVPLMILRANQYCILVNSWDQETNLPIFGRKKLVKGETKFFLHPEEIIEDQIQNAAVLGPEDALVVKCLESFYDEVTHTQRKVGEKWMIYGPTQYIPSLKEQIVGKRKALIQLEFISLYSLFWIPQF